MIRELQFFVRLCRDKSIRKASQALFITPQGLSKSMKSLEAELGVQLFTRSNEGIEPTPAGKLVARKAKAILDEYANMKLELRERASQTGSQIRLTVASGVLHALQPDFLYEYQCGYPEVELTVGEYPDLAGEQAVLDGEAEVGFAIGPIDARKFTAHKLWGGSVSVIVDKSHPLAAKRRVGFRDLAREKWALPNEKYKAYHSVTAKCRELGVKPRIAMLAADIALIFKFCHHGSGIGFASEWALAESGYDSLRSIPLDDESACAWDVYLVSKKRAALSPAARDFAAYVRNWFNADA